jgi:lipoprotein-anchoring transpeptidase ErfK/SrfK
VAGWLLVPQHSAAESERYFADTGYTLNDTHGFLTYWNTHDGEQTIGAPVSDVFIENGLTVQYFEYARLEHHPDLETEQESPPVLLGRIGVEYADALWKSFEPAALKALPGETYYFEEVGHTLSEPFLSYWNDNGAMVAFGYPISEPMWEYVGNRMLQVQYFERARLEHYPLTNNPADEVQRSAIGRDLAFLRGHSTAALAEPGDESDLPPTPTPQPTTVPQPAEQYVEPVAPSVPYNEPVEQYSEPAVQYSEPAPIYTSGKSIVVNISQQWLYAYEGNVIVFDAPISTGRDGFNTPTGNYAIYAKVLSQTMSGTAGGEYYSVPDVPHAMYINGDVAMHGTYWHNMFGTGVRMSHGCINLPLDSAAWLYGWAPAGTPVFVTY